MVNRLFYFKNHTENDAVFIDSGNIFTLDNDSLKNSYALKFLKKLNYDGVGVGLYDIPMEKSYNFLSLNFKEKNRLKYKIIERKGIKIAITSLFDKEWYSFGNSPFLRGDYQIYKNKLDSIKKSVDILIFLSQIDETKENKFFIDNNSIDIFISSNPIEPEFFDLEGRFFSNPGIHSEYIGHLSLLLDNNKKIKSFKNNFIPLDENLYPPDEEGKKIVDEYNFAYSIKMQKEKLNDKRFEYYPESFCRSCHNVSEKIHKHSFNSVSDKGSECLVCHTTGFGTTTGFRLGMDPDKTELENITCSQCHNIPTGTKFDGDIHDVIEVMPSNCQECHVKPHVREFHFYKSKRKLMKNHKVK
ncbi:MAG: hypothetical protein CSA15_12335 [Candidatus Delongbacteria bacterium]|nr:MAG: hypothetical protein CSA15_12335 [Candidatus Delongbacteria bacterium]